MTIAAAVMVREDDGWRVIAHAGGDTAARPPTDDEARDASEALETVPGTRSLVESLVRPPVTLIGLGVAGRSSGVLRLDGLQRDAAHSDSAQALLSAYIGEAGLTLHRLELARSAAQAESLRQADTMKTAILASISHDLKMPLATIKAAASSLLDESVDWSKQDRIAFAESIGIETSRLNRTIDDLLNLNRIETGAIRPIFKTESLADITQDALEMTSGAMGDRELVIDVPDVLVRTDSSLLRHALANLLENAAVHSTPQGPIRVEGCVTGEVVSVVVEDTGPGIAAEDLPYIFNPYYRARNGKTVPKSSGLGLAIVKGFVGLCEGTISVETSPVRSRFVISLPPLEGVTA
jgi:two-component system sensor histidine kinase KdpD